VILGKRDDAIKDLQTSLDLSDTRLRTDPKARNIRDEARMEAGFNPIRSTPEFQKLIPP
jgi:hypothetical protein